MGFNLPRIAIKAERDLSKFWKELNRVLKLCEAQLMHRWGVLKNLRVKDIAFVFGQGLYMNSEGLKPDDTIECALKNGTLSIGFIGLAEALVALTGKHHGEDESAQELGIRIVSRLREFCDEASERNDMNFSAFASPAEGLAAKFIAKDKVLFGEIPGVTDKEYNTNSFHVPVDYPITAYDKIALEAPYHKLCNAGHISYIECQEAPDGNVDGLYKLITHMADCDMGYAGFNYPMDQCRTCDKYGYFPEKCTFCGGDDIRRIRRITGYFSQIENFNAGKRAELRDRTTHA